MTISAGPGSLFEALDRLPAVGILRGSPVAHLGAIAAAAVAAGFTVLEVTLDSPGPLEGIGLLQKAHPDVVVGAGTVRTEAEAEEAIAAGARFIVTPMLDPEVVTTCVTAGIPVVPGAATPTEIWRALDLGASAVKVFPARELGGPAYLRAVLGPLGRPPLVPTGGVGTDNAAALLEAGALAVGVGGSVFPADALRDGDAGRVGSLASALVRSIT
jgi:2-dehydro-3-deoxyphosphogluconate aldolase/(4S)-4-hydroxy-2-oxoglutarate aldolase